MAEELNVSVQQLHKYETGKNRISVEKLVKAAENLGVDLNYFADEKIHVPDKVTSFQEVTAEEEKIVRIFRNIHPNKLRQIWINIGAELSKCRIGKKKE